ncbi:TPR repeat-containing protein [Rhodopirellula islandica]|uniref:TPR repeat-containing protein n=1 Tax=Rhodopirellula islandica TaxID=595434 RepID=A0A0J1EPE6_RHOIS|nr:tetratricopeptide repeat protein [Rhodopirellula islandica]KLU07349.1 TPR repeat-containing protein [Rhodopirellula islandica]
MLDWNRRLRSFAWTSWLGLIAFSSITSADEFAGVSPPTSSTSPDLETASGPSPAQQRMLVMLQQKVAQNPEHSDSWRTLGRLQRRLGDPDAAIASNRKALDLDPFNAAAHFDLGQLLNDQARPDAARFHLQEVLNIAPSSNYADQVRALGIEAPAPAIAQLIAPTTSPDFADQPSAKTGMTSEPFELAHPNDLPAPPNLAGAPTQTVGYEIQTFDGSDDLENRLRQLESEAVNPTSPFRIFLETGLLYNTNVTLTPISRELAQDEQASFQWFASPDLDWKLIRRESSRAGVLFRGYFTANESQFQEFNLASFQPGAFAERDFLFGGNEVIGRMEYVFSNDFFDGNQVGDRHAGTASVTVIRPDLNAWYGYTTVAQSNFEDDGAVPAQTSLDGTTLTFGASHFKRTRWEALPMVALGTDLEYANTKGDDYRYLSINLHGSTDWQISDRWKFTPTWGVGYRNYPDFTDPIGRDEIFWRVDGKLSYQLTEQLSVSAVAGHDRFASDNDDFDTERSEVGVLVGFKR